MVIEERKEPTKIVKRVEPKKLKEPGRKAFFDAAKKLAKDLVHTKDMDASTIHEKTKALRHIITKIGVLDEAPQMTKFLMDKEKETEQKYREELAAEFPHLRGHLDALIAHMDAAEVNEKEIINSSKSLMIEANKTNLQNMRKEEAVPEENLKSSRKVLNYLMLVHDLLAIEERSHISSFESLLETAENIK